MPWLKGTERDLKRLGLWVARGFLRRGKPERLPCDVRQLGRILILRPEKIGDVTVTLPLVAALKNAAPDLEIDLLVSPRSYSLVSSDPRFSRVFVYVKRHLGFLRSLPAMRRRNYACVIDLIDGDSLTGLLLSQLCAAREALRIGNVKPAYARYYDAVVGLTADGEGHSVERSLAVLGFLGVDAASVSGHVPPHVTAASRARVDRFCEQNAMPGAGVRIGYNLSAGLTTRRWALEKSRELLEGILKTYPAVRIVLTTAPPDRARGERLLAHFEDRVCHVPGDFTITDITALLARLDLLITPDTSLVHIARAFKVSVVGLYPRMAWNLQRWYPYGQKGGVVVSGNDDDIIDITPAELLTALQGMLVAEKAGYPSS